MDVAEHGEHAVAGHRQGRVVLPQPGRGELAHDAGKKIKVRNRHILVDTLSLLLGVKFIPASTPERAGALLLLTRLVFWFAWLWKLRVDAGYAGLDFAAAAGGHRPKHVIEVVKRGPKATGFDVLPLRLRFKGTFGCLKPFRRPSDA